MDPYHTSLPFPTSLRAYQNRPKATTTLPANHAGHQTSHTTTCVYKPQTCHPSAALTRTSTRPTPPNQVAAWMTMTGFSTASRLYMAPPRTPFLLERINDNG